MKMLSLFSGIGGIDLAAKWAGIETVAFCEIEPFCQKVLKKHWPNVPIFEDVKKLGKEALEDARIGRVDIVAGGYPCQPYSLAGERKGHEDDRALWPEMFRIISEVRPDWVIGENVAGHVSLGLDNTLSDLEGIGYSCQTFIIPARAVGAVHSRERIFIVANSSVQPMPQKNKEIGSFGTIGKAWGCITSSRGTLLSRVDREIFRPGVVGRDDGVSNRVDRCRALGNAVVPQQIYPIFAAIAEIERCKDAI